MKEKETAGGGRKRRSRSGGGGGGEKEEALRRLMVLLLFLLFLLQVGQAGDFLPFFCPDGTRVSRLYPRKEKKTAASHQEKTFKAGKAWPDRLSSNLIVESV